MSSKESIKCTVIGDHGVGKTSLQIAYTTKAPAPNDVPVLLDPCTVKLRYLIPSVIHMGDEVPPLRSITTVLTSHRMESEKRTLHLWDTTYEQGYTRLCPLWYPATDVFLICFSIDSPPSFERVEEKWVPTARHFRPETPCLIVGTKSELRNDPAVIGRLEKMKMQAVQASEGVEMARKLGCRYVECSARNYDNVEEVFDQAVCLALQSPKVAKKSRCRIL